MEKARLMEMLNVPGWPLMWSMSSALAVVPDLLVEISTPKLGFLQSSEEKSLLLATTCRHAL